MTLYRLCNAEKDFTNTRLDVKQVTLFEQKRFNYAHNVTNHTNNKKTVVVKLPTKKAFQDNK